MSEPETEITERRPAPPAGTKRRTAAIAIAVVALVAAGSAIAASKFHTGTSSAQRGGFGGGFVPGGNTQPGGGRFGPGGGLRGGGLRGGAPGGLTAAASYLGLSESQLFTRLQSGKSLADIAGATSGKSVAGLVAAMVSAEKTNLQAQVTAGRLTQSQADGIASGLTTRIEAMVQGGFGGPPGGFGAPPGQSNNQRAATPGTTL